MSAGSATAAAAAIAQAVKASGVLARREPAGFLKILGRMTYPLVAGSTRGGFTGDHQYLRGYKGLTCYTKSAEPWPLPAGEQGCR